MLNNRSQRLFLLGLLFLVISFSGLIDTSLIARPGDIPRLIDLPRAGSPGRELDWISGPSTAVSVDLSLIDPRRSAHARLEAWLGGSLVVLKLNRIESRKEADFTWFGEVEGQAPSSVILTVVNDFLWGNIRFGKSSYAVESRGPAYALTDRKAILSAPSPGDMRQAALAGARGNGMDLADVELDPLGRAQMDVLVLYTQQLVNTYPAELPVMIQNFVDLANEAYAGSGVNARLRLVGTALYDSLGTRETTSSCNALDNLTDAPVVAGLRESVGADLVSLLRLFNGDDCGCGWVMTSVSEAFADYAFTVVGVRPAWDADPYYCSDTSFAHELGHNMGCSHDRDHATMGGAYSYSYGYDSPGLFATIMSYDTPEIDYFSTPLVLYGGIPIGKDAAAPDSADNARTLNNTTGVVSSFRASVQATGDKHIQIATRGYIHASPLLYDINHDGTREILVGDMAGYVYCFGHDGVKLWEYYAGNAFNKSISPVPDWFNPEVRNNNNLGNITIQSSCAAGDIDGDAIPEIVVGVGGLVDSESSGAGGTTTGYGPVGQGGILILNRDGTLRLLIRSWDTWDSWDPVNGGAAHDGYSDGPFATPALADIDKDGRLDFAIGGIDHNIYAFKTEFKDTSKNGSGELIRFFRPPGRDGFWAVPMFELDDDGDGKLNEDPVADMTPISFYDFEAYISGFPGIDDDLDGLIDEGTGGDDDEDTASPGSLINWDLVDEDEFEWPFRNIDTVISSPAIDDLDLDGYPDIVIGADSSGGTPAKSSRKPIPLGGALRAMTRMAEEIGDFPQAVEQVIWSSPALADADEDGSLEVFVGTGFVISAGGVLKGKGVYAFKSDGTPFLPGKTPYGLFAATSDIVYVSPACGDINGDGDLEIIAADFQTTSPPSSGGYLYAWRRDGTLLPGFPMQPLAEFASMIGNPSVRFAQARSSPILADVDNDGLPEIVLGMGWSILAVNHDGTLVPEFRFSDTSHKVITTGTTLVQAAPAAADLDNNGKIDLVWTTGHSSDGGSTIDYGLIHIWELPTFGSPSPSANPWPAFKRTGTRTSSAKIQFENPVFNPPVATVERGQTVTVSVQVYGGGAPVSSVRYQVEINGANTQVILWDDGSSGDILAGDGRYTGRFTLPTQITTIRNSSFVAQSTLGTLTQAFSIPYRHINIFANVTRYYQTVLGRAPEPGGAEFWTSEIERVAGLGIDLREGFQAAAKLFFNSGEYLSQNNTDTQFVDDLYVTFLNRPADSAGRAFWLDYMAQGLTRNMLITQFAYSGEFASLLEGIFGGSVRRPENNLLNDLYRGFLGRFPDNGGFNSWLGNLRIAQCAGSQAVIDLVQTITLSFIQSPEYAQRNRDDSQYVEDLYNGILRRGADPTGFMGWVDQLGSRTRPDVLHDFTTSPEFQLRVQEVVSAGCVQ